MITLGLLFVDPDYVLDFFLGFWRHWVFDEDFPFFGQIGDVGP